MNTHADVISALGVADVAAQLDVTAEAVAKWRQRGRIPGHFWLSLARYSERTDHPVSLERLAWMAQKRAAKGD